MALSQALPFIDAFVKTVAEVRANREIPSATPVSRSCGNLGSRRSCVRFV
jgi:hypothetical protein